MNRKNFLAVLSGFTAVSYSSFAKKKGLEIEFIRHATFILNIGGLKLLVDPMLSGQHEMDAVRNAPNTERIPMLPLPFAESEMNDKLKMIDAILVTHTHRDHWDPKAQSILNKEKPVICQPPDVEKLKQQGFTNILAVNEKIDFKGLTIHRVNGQHGTGDIGSAMGPVSGFIIVTGKKKIYIAGDTIWCNDVERAIAAHKPDVIVVNAGAAQFNQGDPITMTSNDVKKTIGALPTSKVIAVHMDVINHCRLTRVDLKKELESANLLTNCVIPGDGEKIQLA